MLRGLARWIPLLVLILVAGVSVAQAPAPARRGGATAPAASGRPPPSGSAAAGPAASSSVSGPSGVGAKPARRSASGPGTAGSAAAAPAAPGERAAAPAVDGATYLVRMRDLAQRIDDLKEQIRRSHTRLSLLGDTILSGGVGGARAEIRFQNDLSSAFRLTGALFVLDGQVQYNKQDESGALAAQKSIPIFTGSIPPGDHTLQVQLKLQGYGYGVFSYLRGYRFQTGASHSFTVTAGKTVALEVVAWEKGGVTTPLEERPAIRFTQTVKAASSAPAATATPPARSGRATPPTTGPGSG
jgi:hypothetical protein